MQRNKGNMNWVVVSARKYDVTVLFAKVPILYYLMCFSLLDSSLLAALSFLFEICH